MPRFIDENVCEEYARTLAGIHLDLFVYYQYYGGIRKCSIEILGDKLKYQNAVSASSNNQHPQQGPVQQK